MADFLSISSLMILGELITTAVAGPILREKMPPYCCAHSVNLGKDQHRLMNLEAERCSLEVCTSLWKLVQIAYQWESRWSFITVRCNQIN